MGMRRGSLPADDMIDVDDRSKLLVDKIQYSLPFRGRRWPVDSGVDQCPVQRPPVAAAYFSPGVMRENSSGCGRLIVG
jgi:hypothetical protein